jgi:valyl-tRNA synthetase
MEMNKVYNPQDLEKSTYQLWLDRQAFMPQAEGPVFSMVIPPPNVTGVLHMGHALNITLQDIYARYKRLHNYRVMWLPGFDHAGIATQNVVERHLKKENISRFAIGREKFVEYVWQWKDEYEKRIRAQICRLGASVDWSKARFTLDDGCVQAVLETFVSLYEKGLIYRGRRIINWCPRCKTALSDIEVDHIETEGKLWVIGYPLKDNPEISIHVATTRPETMFGDTAIAVNPDDNRFSDFVGKEVIIPILNKAIPVIIDARVEKDFGTGAVKVTPAHDPNDFTIGQDHELEQVLVIDESGMMNENSPQQFVGQDRYQCREQLLLELKEKNYLINTEEHQHAVGHCYRCHTVIEPYLSNQWFVDMKSLVKNAIDVVKSGEITFIPKRWEKLYFDWMEGIRDWCISRQIWWGHRIPVWYCPDHPDKPLVARTRPEKCPLCAQQELIQESDVLDTWFSSALWPFSTFGWPQNTEALNTYYPTSLLITGYDILTFWVSRMITIGLEKTKQCPFSEVYIHGLVRDASGKKMSKSLGNALDPITLIDEYGADALRLSLASLSTLGGQDIKFSTEKIQAARNYANKIWNVARYILMILNDSAQDIDLKNITYTNTLANLWIISSFHSTLQQINKNFDSFNFAQITELLWDYSWNKFCDWYIEISKSDKQNSLGILVHILVNLLILLHPIMPYLTEEIWQKLVKSKHIVNLDTELLINANWPLVAEELINNHIETNMQVIMVVIREIRNLKKQLNINFNHKIDLILVSANKNDFEFLNIGKDYIISLAKVENLTILEKLEKQPKQASSSVIQNIQIFIPLEGLIDFEKESQRLSKKKDLLLKEQQTLQKKLTNEHFMTKAPEMVINKIKNQAEQISQEIALVTKQLNQLA